MLLYYYNDRAFGVKRILDSNGDVIATFQSRNMEAIIAYEHFFHAMEDKGYTFRSWALDNYKKVA